MALAATQVVLMSAAGCDEERPEAGRRVAGARRAPADGAERQETAPPALSGERTVRVQVDHLPGLLNPLVSRDIWCRWITVGTIFEPLVKTTRDGDFRPQLAQSMRFEAGGRKLVLHLRRGVTFHDGHPLTSEDVKYTLDALARRKPATLDLLAAALTDLQAVEAPDPSMVVILLRRRDRMFPAVLAEIGILPAHRYRQRGLGAAKPNREPIGTGPFRFEQRHGRSSLVLARNTRYWGAGAGIARLRFEVLGEPKQALAALRNGEIDVLTRLAPTYFPDQVSSPRMQRRFRVVRSRPYRLRVVLYNAKRGPLRDRRVRLALAHMVDRATMVQELHNGLAELLTGPLWVGSAGYDATLPLREHDPPRAAQLLDAAGWQAPRPGLTRRRKGYPLALRVLYSTDSKEAAEVARQLKDALVAAGIKPVVKGGDFGFVKTRLARGSFDLAIMGLAPIPGTSLEPFLHSKGSLNVGRYDNAVVDQLLTRLRVIEAAERRAEVLRELHRTLHEDPPLLVLYGAADVTVARRPIQGLQKGAGWPSLARLRLAATPAAGPR